jgi:HK97 family phage prohead protease
MTAAIRLAGYAAIFHQPDRGGDIIRPGAFATAKAGLPLLLGHDVRRRIGTVDHLSEDDRGLRIIARAKGVTVQPGQGLSFGYRVRAARRGDDPQYRELTGLELIEVSLVTNPMQPLARVLATEPTPHEDDVTKETKNGL